jgi:hypothetical protein
MNDLSPRLTARLAGLMYILEGLASVFGQMLVPGMLVVSTDAAATATNILASDSLFRLGIASGLLAVAFHIAQTVLFYLLFRPVSRVSALMLASFSLVAIGLQAASILFQVAPLVVLGGARDLGAFSTEQLEALSLLFLKWRGQAYNIYLVFFGFRCILLGYLIYKSTFMPRVIGGLMAVAGVGYLLLLWPPLVNRIAPFNLALAAPGELWFVFWLLVYGVRSQLGLQLPDDAASSGEKTPQRE